MNRIAFTILATSIAAASGLAFAQGQYSNSNRGPVYDNVRADYARVISVERVGGQYSTRLMQECWNERTKSNEQGYYRDNSGRLYRGDHNGKAGTVIGAIIGGALGNQVGSGDGRKAATIAGAVIGGAVASKHNQRDDYDGYDYYDGDGGTQLRCRTVSEPTGSYGRRGYLVTYDYAGQSYKAFSTIRPGRTIPVIVDVRPR
ncbi:MAG TPA: glycine zipper 2TM domain-containing protein [Pseudomonadota bacterium]|nr:glycine zipper 2TM domain-containing protein [Pseudomonadota bacterium]